MKAGGCLVGTVPVAQHQCRVVGWDAQHPFFVGGYFLPRCGIEQLYVVSRLNETRRPWTNRLRNGLAEIVRALRHAETFVDVEPEALAPSMEHLRREMLTRAHAMMQCRHIGPAVVGA